VNRLGNQPGYRDETGTLTDSVSESGTGPAPDSAPGTQSRSRSKNQKQTKTENPGGKDPHKEGLLNGETPLSAVRAEVAGARTARTCNRCGETKPITEYNRDGKTPDGRQRRRAICRACDAVRVAEYHRWASQADPTYRERRRVASRDWRARNADVARARNRVKARRAYEQLRQDPERYARYLEDARMRYRLRLLRAGKAPALVPPREEPRNREVTHRLPAAPLAAVLARFVAREGVDEERGGGVGRVCDRAGIPDRTYFAWRTGEREHVNFDVADRVLTNLGLMWWDVWTPAQVEGTLYAIDEPMEQAA
jgi:hypothetical protein